MKKTEMKCESYHDMYWVDRVNDVDFYVCMACLANYRQEEGELVKYGKNG